MATIEKIAAHSAYEMFSWYKYLIVGLVFSHLGFWSGNLFLIASFPDLCLLVPFYVLHVVRYGPFPFSLICSLLLKDISSMFISHYVFVNTRVKVNNTLFCFSSNFPL